MAAQPRRYSSKQVLDHKEQLAKWIRANGINPDEVALDPISVTPCPCCGQLLIQYSEYLLDEHGKRYYDQASDDAAMTARLSPCTVPPPDLG